MPGCSVGPRRACPKPSPTRTSHRCADGFHFGRNIIHTVLLAVIGQLPWAGCSTAHIPILCASLCSLFAPSDPWAWPGYEAARQALVAYIQGRPMTCNGCEQDSPTERNVISSRNKKNKPTQKKEGCQATRARSTKASPSAKQNSVQSAVDWLLI